MIRLNYKKECCGCYACASVCPKGCIEMREDNEGFRYPVIDVGVCINCSLCEKVCPVINQNKERTPLKTYAAKNQDEAIRKQSSSGGIFTLLAKQTIARGGTVFGAGFDKKWEVCHASAQTLTELTAFRGSKYLQSRVEDTYCQAEALLKRGTEVLFSGTPCQIAGLKGYLRKEYENLLTVDFVCHGVPSPAVWREYLKVLLANTKEPPERIGEIRFRNKKSGWKNYSLTISSAKAKNSPSIISQPYNKNLFMRGFLKDIYLRPSCHACPAKKFKSGSDTTLGDYWGIQHVLPEFDDEKGVSLIMTNTPKGEGRYLSLKAEQHETTYGEALKNNPSIEKSAPLKFERTVFYRNFAQEDLLNLINRLTKNSFPARIRRKLQNLFHKRRKTDKL